MNDEKFTFSYSPSRNIEVDEIIAKYADADESKDSDLERLRRLDRRAELPGTAAGIATGLIGILILCMGIILIVRSGSLAAGTASGAAGLLIAGGAVPVSRAVTRHSRRIYRDEIIALGEKIKRGK